VFRHIPRLVMVVYVCTAMCAANALTVKKEDPLRPPEYRLTKASVGAGKKTVSGWYVNEILFSGLRRVAIVNNIAVSKGDRVNGARVVDIMPSHVVLEYKSKIIKTHLKMVSIKKKVSTN